MEKISFCRRDLVGTLFDTGSDSVVVVLGGSSGGKSELAAENLAKRGFSALALAYFAIEPLPPMLKNIPLEYFEKTLTLLKQRFKHIALWGGSRGAELSLILGTYFPSEIVAIAAHVPSSAIYGTLDGQDACAWTYKGEPIAPSAPFRLPEALLGESPETAIVGREAFLKGMEQKEAFAAALIPVEKIRCPLLLISGQDDLMWPSDLFAQQIVARLKAHQSPIDYLHLSYPQVGHAPYKGSVGFHPLFKRWVAFGGEAAANARATQEWMEQTVCFFQKQF